MPSFHVKHRALEFVYNDPTGRQNGRLSRLNLFFITAKQSTINYRDGLCGPKGTTCLDRKLFPFLIQVIDCEAPSDERSHRKSYRILNSDVRRIFVQDVRVMCRPWLQI